MSYRSEVLRNMNKEVQGDDRFLMGALGLTGEAGETAEHVKKYFFHGKALNKDALVKELGDVRFYLEVLAIACGVTMEQVENLNIDKLRKRYPNGFSTEASEARVDIND